MLCDDIRPILQIWNNRQIESPMPRRSNAMEPFHRFGGAVRLSQNFLDGPSRFEETSPQTRPVRFPDVVSAVSRYTESQAVIDRNDSVE